MYDHIAAHDHGAAGEHVQIARGIHRCEAGAGGEGAAVLHVHGCRAGARCADRRGVAQRERGSGAGDRDRTGGCRLPECDVQIRPRQRRPALNVQSSVSETTVRQTSDVDRSETAAASVAEGESAGRNLAQAKSAITTGERGTAAIHKDRGIAEASGSDQGQGRARPSRKAATGENVGGAPTV